MSTSLMVLAIVFFVLFVAVFVYMAIGPLLKKKKYWEAVLLTFITIIASTVSCYFASRFLDIETYSAQITIFLIVSGFVLFLFLCSTDSNSRKGHVDS